MMRFQILLSMMLLMSHLLSICAFGNFRVNTIKRLIQHKNVLFNQKCWSFPSLLARKCDTRCFGRLNPSDSYQSVQVMCSKCLTKLFKYKKKNGAKSRLIKLYLERIVDDPFHLVTQYDDCESANEAKLTELLCPKCGSPWGRPSMKAGNKIFKCIGGKLKIK